MDPYQGFEVGAEVELNDDPSLLEDLATVIVENKQDLPAWHHLHYAEESSSDESLDHVDHQLVFPTSPELKNMEAPAFMPKVKSQAEGNHPIERKICLVSEGLYMEHVLQNDLQSVVWGDEYNSEHQDQACSLGPGVEGTEISHFEVVPASYSSPPPAELSLESMLPHEGDEVGLLGKYSFYNAKTQSVGTVKPWVRSHRCAKCGRQFGRLYNLESHMCIHKAVTGVNVEDFMCSNVLDISHSGDRCQQSEESMNRLEKMCAEAQEELRNLQGLYKTEEVKPLQSNSVGPPYVGVPAPSNKVVTYKPSFTCDRCGRRFRRRFNLGFHICCSELKPSPSAIERDQTSSSQDLPPTKSESLDHVNKAEVFECQFCGKVYNRRASYGTHIRWHLKEKDLVSSVNKSIATGHLNPLLTSIDTTPMGSKKKSGPTFTCEECGRVFSKLCSYSTHVLWHIRRRNAGSAVAMLSVNQAVEGQGIRTQDTQVVEGQEIRTKETQMVEGLEIRTWGTQVVEGQEIRTQDTQVVESWEIRTQETQAVEGREIRTKETQMVEGREIRTWGTQVVEGQEIRTKETQMVEGREIKMQEAQVMEDQEMSSEEAQVCSVSAKSWGRTKASPDMLTCQECGRVFYKRIAYANHSRWHIRERELEQRVKATFRTIGHQVQPPKGGSSNNLPISNLEGHHFQGYKHVNLDEPQNFYIDEEGNETVDNPEGPGQLSTPAEVPEFVFELVVGSECCHESLTSKSEVSETEGNVAETTTRTQTSCLASDVKEPVERPVSLSRASPYKMSGHLLQRPRPPYRCRDCGAGFSQFWKLKLHQHQGARRRWRKYNCDCGRSLTGLLHFLRHQLQHLSDTAFICAVCGKLLRGYLQLQAHRWVHPLVSQFQCKCGARFTRLSRYLWHSLLNRTKERRPKEETHPKT